MNTLKYIEDGIEGRNKGLPLRDPILDLELGGLKKATIYGIGAEQKVGKTAFLVEQFILGPLLDAMNYPDLEYPVYYYFWATEMTRQKTELGCIAYLAYEIFGDMLDVEYLSGHRKDRKGNVVALTKREYSKVRYLYHKFIIPLFGQFNNNNVQIRPGRIKFFDYKENPTGIRNFIIQEMAKHGEIQKKRMGNVDVITGFVPHDPRSVHVGIIDHIRGLAKERGFSMKENIDKMSEYMVDTRNKLGVSWVITSHLNRSNNDVMRLKLLGQFMYPATEAWKDSGNVSEDANVIINLFNPTDEKYGLIRKGVHMNKDILPYVRYGDYRTVHITENRDGPSPQHLAYRFRGAVKRFEYLSHLPETK